MNRPTPAEHDRELRNFLMREVRIEDLADGGVRIVGHAAVFDQLSEDLGGFRERIKRGAFAKSLRRDDVRALFNHDENFVLARNRAGTLTLEEDDVGLKSIIHAPPTTWARDLAVSMRRGDVNQMSFAFAVSKEGQQWRKRDDGLWERSVSEVSRLYDVSIVAFPAYPQATAAVRALEDLKAHRWDQLTPDQRRRERTEGALARSGHGDADPYMRRAEARLRQIEDEIAAGSTDDYRRRLRRIISDT